MRGFRTVTQPLPALPPSAVPSHPVLRAVGRMRQAVTSVAEVNPTFMAAADKADALVQLASLSAQVDELRLRIMATADDVAAEAAARDIGGWYAHETRSDAKAAKVEADLAVELERRWTRLAQALRAGDLSTAQAKVIARSLAGLVRWVDAEILLEAETALVALAAEHGPRQLAALGARILAVVAPDLADEIEARRLAEEEADVAEKITASLRHHSDGSIRFNAIMDKLTGTRFAVILEAYTNPRKTHSSETDQPTSCDPAAGDDGTLSSSPDPVQRLPRGRKLGQAFCTFLESLDPRALPRHGGDQTLLMICIDFKELCADLAAGTILTTAAIPGPGPDAAGATSTDRVTASEIRRLACNAQILPAVLGDKSEILDLGRSRRLFSPAQQRALLLRDRTCRAEGCFIPGTWAEAHHWVPWSKLGETNLDDGVLLCSFHHHRIHQEDAYEGERLPNGDVRFHRRT
jgi:hypothetical protein